jgi:hypothetical protein
VIVLENHHALLSYLRAWGYHQDVATKTLQEIRSMAEFTIDLHLPIFVNASSLHVQRIVRSWQTSRFPDQSARVMASDLYHEYLHAVHGACESKALKGHITLLKQWRDAGFLTIADLYIASKEAELRVLEASPREHRPEGRGGRKRRGLVK